MDLEIIIRSEVSQTEKGRCHDIAFMWNLKYNAAKPIQYCKVKKKKKKKKEIKKNTMQNRNRLREQTHSYQRGKVGKGGINQEDELTCPYYNI